MSAAERIREERSEKQFMPKAMFIGLLLILGLIAGFLFVNSAYFAVGNIAVEGNKYLSAEEIYRIAGVPEHVNIFRLNTAEIKNRLLNDLRIADATVTRQLPATIVITLTERRPVAFIASGLGFVEVDRQGIVLAVYKNIKSVHVPILTGYRLGNIYVGDAVESPQVRQILNFLALLDENALNQLSELNISGERLSAYTVSSVTIRLGALERLEEKARLTVAILAEIKQKKLDVDYIDLTYASPFIKIKQ